MINADAIDGLRKTIIAAFSASPYPGDEQICADQSANDPECQEIAAAFRGKHWKDVSVEMVREHADALPLLTPAAFRYFLPAYMVASAEAYYDVDVASESVLSNLTPPAVRDGWQWDFFLERARQFDRAQRNAINSFLRVLRQIEVDDWASAGSQPPDDRFARAIEFWDDQTGTNTK
jgi:hypothetical protein